MQQGVPILNVIVTILYLLAVGITLLLLKLALRPTLRPPRPNPQNHNNAQSTEQVGYGRIAALSYIKKCTIIGGLLCEQKKYLLKELLVIGVMGICCLGINQVILWPVALGVGVGIVTYLLVDIVVKKVTEGRVQEAAVVTGQSQSQARPRPESEIEIESVGIEESRGREEVKRKGKIDRSNFEIMVLCAVGLTSMVLLLQTAITIGNSISNSGQLNIISLLIMLAIDQFTIRPLIGIVYIGTLQIVSHFTDTPLQSLGLAQPLIQEEIYAIWREQEKERERKKRQMVASPPRKKEDSPSRVPKALGGEQSTYLNLISLQPTSKPRSEDEEEKDEVIQEIYLTTAERDMFHLGIGQEGRKVQEPKRKSTKENKEYLCFSERRSKFPTIQEEKPGFDDLMILRNGPLNEMEDNIIAEFNLEESPPRHRRRAGVPFKKAKRQLKVTGSSPYLEYLPAMLQKVDGYKEKSLRQRKIL